MKTIILAAGYATRLYPLTKNKPKALLPIGSKPLLTHLVGKINEITSNQETVLVTNSLFTKQFEDWAKTAGATKPIRVVDDGTTSNDNRLGAIGDMRFALEKGRVDDDVLMLASDNLFDGSLDEFARFASAKNAPAIGVHDLKDPMLGSKRYGMVKLDASSRIIAIEEKPEKPSSSFASMGLYYFPKSTLAFVDEYLASTSKQDAPGYYVTWLMGKTPIYAHALSGRWYDIGSIDQLEEANREYENAGQKS